MNSEFYSSIDDLKGLVKDSLSLNPLSRYDQKSHNNKTLYAIELDNFNFIYRLELNKVFISKVLDAK